MEMTSRSSGELTPLRRLSEDERDYERRKREAKTRKRGEPDDQQRRIFLKAFDHRLFRALGRSAL